jgi:hypothetical protein
MKFLPPALFVVLASCASVAGDPAAPPAYVSEAPLPKGWPEPGPYNVVTEKSLPAYRAAFTTQPGQSRAFWRLFLHIKKNEIPMTAPVEMAMNPADDGLSKSTMAFLYQNEAVGKTGPAGETIEVRDVPAATVLSYTWQGRDSKDNIEKARGAIDAALTQRKLKPTSYRLLGYNGPSTPRAKATWELQAIIK